MKREKQIPLEGFKNLGMREFGGSLLKGNPREARPVSNKRAMHLVMRSTQAKGAKSFLKPDRARRIEELVPRLAKEKGVKLYRFANSGNHLHMLVLPKSRPAFNGFVRSISGIIARLTLERERGPAAAGDKRERARGGAREGAGESWIQFWDARPFTRIVEWGREFNTVSRYVVQNVLEAVGFLDHQPRKHKHKTAGSTA